MGTKQASKKIVKKKRTGLRQVFKCVQCNNDDVVECIMYVRTHGARAHMHGFFLGSNSRAAAATAAAATAVVVDKTPHKHTPATRTDGRSRGRASWCAAFAGPLSSAPSTVRTSNMCVGYDARCGLWLVDWLVDFDGLSYVSDPRSFHMHTHTHTTKSTRPIQASGRVLRVDRRVRADQRAGGGRGGGRGGAGQRRGLMTFRPFFLVVVVWSDGV